MSVGMSMSTGVSAGVRQVVTYAQTPALLVSLIVVVLTMIGSANAFGSQVDESNAIKRSGALRQSSLRGGYVCYCGESGVHECEPAPPNEDQTDEHTLIRINETQNKKNDVGARINIAGQLGDGSVLSSVYGGVDSEIERAPIVFRQALPPIYLSGGNNSMHWHVKTQAHQYAVVKIAPPTKVMVDNDHHPDSDGVPVDENSIFLQLADEVPQAVLPCYVNRLQSNANLAGAVSVRLDIDQTGQIHSPAITIDSIGDSVLLGCIMLNMESLKLGGSARPSTIRVHFPLYFSLE